MSEVCANPGVSAFARPCASGEIPLRIARIVSPAPARGLEKRGDIVCEVRGRVFARRSRSASVAESLRRAPSLVRGAARPCASSTGLKLALASGKTPLLYRAHRVAGASARVARARSKGAAAVSAAFLCVRSSNRRGISQARASARARRWAPVRVDRVLETCARATGETPLLDRALRVAGATALEQRGLDGKGAATAFARSAGAFFASLQGPGVAGPFLRRVAFL
jgi:hypothetical protein